MLCKKGCKFSCAQYINTLKIWGGKQKKPSLEFCVDVLRGGAWPHICLALMTSSRDTLAFPVHVPPILSSCKQCMCHTHAHKHVDACLVCIDTCHMNSPFYLWLRTPQETPGTGGGWVSVIGYAWSVWWGVCVCVCVCNDVYLHAWATNSSPWSDSPHPAGDMGGKEGS